METITIHPKDKEQLATVAAILKALKIPFEKTKGESLYNPEFVKEVRKADKEFKKGKGYKMTMAELEKLCK